MSAYEASSSVVIADVDCTVEQELCQRFDVKGYPTIKYFSADTPATGEDYSGGRDLPSLEQFALENLGPVCGPEHRELCNAQQIAVMDEAAALSESGLNDAIAQMEKEIEDLEAQFAARSEELETELKAKEFKIMNRRGLYTQTKGELFKHKVFRYIWVNLVEIVVGIILVVGGLYAYLRTPTKKKKQKRR